MTNYKRETIMLTNEEQDYYSIYTYNANLKRRLAAFARKKPNMCHLDNLDGHGGQTYHIQKDAVVIQFRAPMSERERQERSDRLKVNPRGFFNTASGTGIKLPAGDL